MQNIDPKKLMNWSMWAGFLGVVLYVLALVMLWQGGGTLVLDRFDHKDFYFAGSGFLYAAVWFALVAIFRKGQ